MFLHNLIEDARSIRDRDPAARSTAEVFLLYPGFHALLYHRLTHWLYQHKRFFLARMISQFARTMTGVEIHPGATIGRGLFIDHGMGIVIGETAEVETTVPFIMASHWVVLEKIPESGTPPLEIMS